jgi:hypothetical protein
MVGLAEVRWTTAALRVSFSTKTSHHERGDTGHRIRSDLQQQVRFHQIVAQRTIETLSTENLGMDHTFLDKEVVAERHGFSRAGASMFVRAPLSLAILYASKSAPVAEKRSGKD